MKICIDAGHNDTGWDTGAQGCGIREQDITFSVAHKTAELLRKLGFDVLETRPTKETNLGTNLNSSLQARCNMANAWGADYFISIHCNSFPNPAAHGTETYIIAQGGKAEELAYAIQREITTQVGTADRGVKVQNLKVLRSTDMPAVLVELAYLCNTADNDLLKNKQNEFAAAIVDGLTDFLGFEHQESTAPLTVQLLSQVYIQEIYPPNFGIYECNCPKRDVDVANYFNLGFFALEGAETIPVGNLADSGVILAQSKDNPAWINLSGHPLTTLYVKKDGTFGFTMTDDLTTIEGLQTAVSGIPILMDGQIISMDDIKAEGYFGSELYTTWHTFLGIRGVDIVYAGFEAGFDQMPWILLALGIQSAICLDGGGSFILHNGRELISTPENRKINNVGMWHE